MSGEYYADGRTSVNLAFIDNFCAQKQGIFLPKKISSALSAANYCRCVWLNCLLTAQDYQFSEVEKWCSTTLPVYQQYLPYRFFRLLKSPATILGKQKISLLAVERLYQQLLGEKKSVSYKREVLADLISWLNEDVNTHVLLRLGVAFKLLLEERVFFGENQLMSRLLLLLLLKYFSYDSPSHWLLEEYDLLSMRRYYSRIERPSNGDYAAWLDYFVKGVRYGMQVSLDNTKKLASVLKDSQQLTQAQEKMWSVITFAGVGEKNLASQAELVGVSKQRAHVLLAELVDKGMIERLGKGKKITFRSAWNSWW